MLKRMSLFLAVLGLLAGPVLAAVPQLAALAGWRAGLWQESTGESGGSARSLCLAAPDRMLMGSHGDAGGCEFTTIRDEGSRASITYVCKDGRQGRTDLRRDTADVYTVYAQGLAGGRPFARRSEWRRTGNC